MWDTVLVVRTTDRRDDGPSHFRMYLTQEQAEGLMQLRAAFRAAHEAAHQMPLCVEFMRSDGEWGNIAGFDADREGEWATALRTVRMEKPESVELESAKVSDTGVIFSAAWKNDDSGVYFETPELPWAVLAKFAASPDGVPDALPAAVIDYEENTLSTGAWMDEVGDVHEDDDTDEDEEDE